MKIIHWFNHFLATGFFSGLISPIGRGTVGSFVAILLVYLFMQIGLSAADFYLLTIASIIISIFVVADAESFASERWGPSKRYNGKWSNFDRSETVIDEFIGIFISSMAVYIHLNELTSGELILNMIFVFIMFRIFDITKILGIKMIEDAFIKMGRYVENYKSNLDSEFNLGGLIVSFGVIVDDVIAGLYTGVMSTIILKFFV